jgi:hypothetical protein
MERVNEPYSKSIFAVLKFVLFLKETTQQTDQWNIAL